MLIRKKKRETAEWVPAALVRAYLDRVKHDERDIRYKLFGEESPATGYAAAPQMVVNANDPALAREMEALRAQLLAADQRSIEFDRLMNALKAEKAALEQKLKDAPAGGAAPAGAAPEVVAAAQKEVADLKAKLQEYEVIEDDLANLKKFQKENEQLKQKIEQYEKGGAAPLTVIPGGKTEATPTTTVSGAAPAPAPTTVVSGGAAPTAPAEPAKPAAAPVAAAPAPTESNTNVLQPVTPTVDAPAAAPVAAAPAAEGADKTPKQKEEELLSEFEKMLAS